MVQFLLLISVFFSSTSVGGLILVLDSTKKKSYKDYSMLILCMLITAGLWMWWHSTAKG